MERVSNTNLSFIFKFFKDVKSLYSFFSPPVRIDNQVSLYLESNTQSVGIFKVLSTSIDLKERCPELVKITSSGWNHVKHTLIICFLGLKDFLNFSICTQLASFISSLKKLARHLREFSLKDLFLL